jgi:hypothetical protein
MEWSDISSTISKYAPLVATTLSSPVGVAIGAGTIIANLFGVEEKPESIMDYIKNNPEKAQEKISIFEMIKEKNRHEETIDSLTLKSQQGAQSNSVNVNASPVDNVIKMRLVNSEICLLFLCVASLIGSMFYDKPIETGVLSILSMIVGYLLKSSIGEKDGYYWGTSFSSQKKDDVIAGKR